MTIIQTWIPSSGSNAGNIRFNGDTGTNYNYRFAASGAAEATATNGTSLASGSADSVGLRIGSVVNIANKEKVVYFQETGTAGAGAGVVPTRLELAGKWANTASQINQITMLASAGTFAVGSEVIVLGHD